MILLKKKKTASSSSVLIHKKKTKEIALLLNDFVSDWIDDSLDNVIIAEHTDFSSRLILAHRYCFNI